MYPRKTFADLQQDTPRLVVMFKQDDNKELFQWGIVSEIPLLSLIGQIVRVQNELPLLEPNDPYHDCSESALVIAYEAKAFYWFVHPDIPKTTLVGMLETIKITLLGAQAARRMASEQLILGPDGRPVRR